MRSAKSDILGRCYFKCDADKGYAVENCHLTAAVIENTEPAFEGKCYEAEFILKTAATCSGAPFGSRIYMAASTPFFR